MTKPRRRFSPEEKVRILRRRRPDKVPVPGLYDEFGLSPNVFYSWQGTLFETGPTPLPAARPKSP